MMSPPPPFRRCHSGGVPSRPPPLPVYRGCSDATGTSPASPQGGEALCVPGDPSDHLGGTHRPGRGKKVLPVGGGVRLSPPKEGGGPEKGLKCQDH